MEVVNHTGFPHLLFKTCLDGNRMAYSIAIRIGFQYSKSEIGLLNEPLALSSEDWASPYGLLTSDLIFKREGADIYIYGHAYHHGHTKGQSSVQVYYNNKLIQEVLIFGKRVWSGSGKNMNISEPETFDRIPLDLSSSYGGVAHWDGLDIPYAGNPYGKGYYLTEEEAIGNELPNIEGQERLISHWTQKVDPAGLGQFPMNHMRAKRGTETNDEENKIIRTLPLLFNCAATGMIRDVINPGDRIRIVGASDNGWSEFVLPNLNVLAAINLGDKQHNKRMYIDQLLVVPDQDRFYITYRYHFLHDLKPLSTRMIELKRA